MHTPIKKENEKKEINIKCVDDNGWLFSSDTLIYQILNKHYKVNISNDPEYLFFSDRSSQNLDYEDCIKIFYTEENCEPDFNLCDYAISFQKIDYGCRHFRIPNWIALGSARNYDRSIERMNTKHIINKKST